MEHGEYVWEYTYDYGNRVVSVEKGGQLVEGYTMVVERGLKRLAQNLREFIFHGLTILYEVNTGVLQVDKTLFGSPGI